DSRIGAFKLLTDMGVLIAISIATAEGWQLKLDTDQRTAATALTGGDPERGGARIIREFGCSGCHTIENVAGARELVGPPLNDIARRVYVGGTLVNTPGNLVSWIVDPRIHNPRTAMPVTGITREEARDMA